MEDNAHLPVMAHSSPAKTKAACNCGRKQADKDDPFDHKVSRVKKYLYSLKPQIISTKL